MKWLATRTPKGDVIVEFPDELTPGERTLAIWRVIAMLADQHHTVQDWPGHDFKRDKLSELTGKP